MGGGSKHPNIKFEVATINSQPFLLFRSIRDIKQNEELFYDYGDRKGPEWLKKRSTVPVRSAKIKSQKAHPKGLENPWILDRGNPKDQEGGGKKVIRQGKETMPHMRHRCL